MTTVAAPAPWEDPADHPGTTMRAPEMDLATLAAAIVRLDEIARLAALPCSPATTRELPFQWNEKDLACVVHRDPESRAVLVRGGPPKGRTLRPAQVALMVVDGVGLAPFRLTEPLLGDDSNDPAATDRHAQAARWYARLTTIARTLARRLTMNGLHAGDPYHEIGQTLDGSLAARVSGLIVHTLPDVVEAQGHRLAGRIVAPSPYGPLEAIATLRTTSTETTFGHLLPDAAAAWSRRLGSTVQLDKGSPFEMASLSLSPPTSTLFAISPNEDPVDLMRAVRVFPWDGPDPFVRTHRTGS